MYIIGSCVRVDFLYEDGSRERRNYTDDREALKDIANKDFFRADLFRQTTIETRDTFIKKKD